MLTIPLPLEFILYPLLSILIYSVCLNGAPIFDDMEVLPNAQSYTFQWNKLKTGRVISSFFMALWMKWPGTMRGVHSVNCWLHAFNALLVERIALKLGCDPVQGLTCGLFFVAMPFAANTVSYMSGQANLWGGLFGLLGVLAILSGDGLLALPCLLATYLSKEDGIGFAVTFVGLAGWTRSWWTLGLLLVAGVVAVIHQWKWLRHLADQTGDQQMSAIGLPVSHPQPRHGVVVLLATLWRLPFWFLGLKQSPYHGSGIKRW